RVNEGGNIGRGGNYGGGQQYRPHNVSAREQLQEISAELKNIHIGSGNHHHQQQQQQQQQQHQHPRDDQQHHHYNNQHHNNQHPNNQHHRGRGRGGGGRGSVPPRMQDSSSGNAGSNRGVSNNSGDGNSGEGNGGSSRPKRYSSQRQRSLPDQPGSPYQGQHQGYIDQGHDQGGYGGFEGGNNSTRSSSSMSGQQQHMGSGGSFVPPAYTSPNNFPAEPFLGRPPAPRMFTTQTGPGPHMMPPGVAGSPVGVGGGPPRVVGPPGVGGVGGPPGVAVPPVGVPTVGGPPVTGPPFLPAENMISYVGPPPPPPHPGPPHLGPLPATAPFAGPPPPQFPPFQGYPPGPTSQPQEIYSNGVTYYNTQNQQVVPRVIQPLQKRPKAAIPIVPPPDSSSSNNQDTEETSGVQDINHPIESQEQTTGEQYQEISEENGNSQDNQIKEEINGVDNDKKQISSPSPEIIKIEDQQTSNDKKETNENIVDTEKASLEEKVIDNTEIKKIETKEVIEENDVKKAVELPEEKFNDDKKCDGESGEAAVLVETPIAAS
ncbi:unnamed protein product, partial [Meganyctiphanes norvegica]